MGFDQRSHRRIPLGGTIRFWPYGENFGTGTTGAALNLSESGLAFNSAKSAAKGKLLQVEFRIPNRSDALRLLSEVVLCEAGPPEQGGWHVGVHFLEPSGEDFVAVRRHLLQTTDPKLAAATGWGRVLPPGKPAIAVQYRELNPEQFDLWNGDRSFLLAEELWALTRFKDLLESAVGDATPNKFRLWGSLRLPEKSKAWLELALLNGSLRLLCDTVWTRQEKGEDPEAELLVLAYNKQDAEKLDREI